MYDPNMITASILGTQGVRGRNFMGSMFGEQIDVKLSTLKCQHYTPENRKTRDMLQRSIKSV